MLVTTVANFFIDPPLSSPSHLFLLKGARRALHHIGLAEKVVKGGAPNKPKNNFATDQLKTDILGLPRPSAARRASRI